MFNVLAKIGLAFGGFLIGVIAGAKIYPEVEDWMESRKENESVDDAE